jgi:hypothetical protein
MFDLLLNLVVVIAYLSVNADPILSKHELFSVKGLPFFGESRHTAFKALLCVLWHAIKLVKFGKIEVMSWVVR